MPRPFTRAQALENQAFLAALRTSGNVRAAARSLGAHRAKFTKRRARDAAFAAEWDAALAIAHAELNASAPPSTTAEPRILRTRNGQLQLRRATPGRLDRAAEQAFLEALAATGNIRLSAAAAGFSHSAFYARRRTHPAFAREMRLALEMGYERLEQAMLASMDPASHRDDAWRLNDRDPPPLPPMTFDQGLALLQLHQREVRLYEERTKRLRGETSEQHSARLARRWHADKRREAEDDAVAAAAQTAARSRVPAQFEPPPPVLPPLDTLRPRPRG